MLLALTLVWLAGLAVSGWQPFDRATWVMEVAPALIALPLLWVTAGRFPLTRLALALIAVHGLVLMLGGAYTYARVPIGFAAQDLLGLARNPYDRLGHFMQGFVPAIVLRELLIRLGGLRPGKLLMVLVLVLACCLAVSATYELIEFGAAQTMGQGAEAFLGTQGDMWDTQWDMLMCLIGAACALVLLTRVHDQQIGAL
jgi:putative membrane protein